MRRCAFREVIVKIGARCWGVFGVRCSKPAVFFSHLRSFTSPCVKKSLSDESQPRGKVATWLSKNEKREISLAFLYFVLVILIITYLAFAHRGCGGL